MNQTITDVPNILVGHASDLKALTGCTVVLCPPGTVGGVDQRGGAPGTRETDLLRPMHLVEHVHAVFLAGGSAFGLDAGGGIMRYLEERGQGFDVGVARVPIVPGAILFDLGIGSASVRPDAAMGYAACENASAAAVEQGCVGAGTGATIGKMFGVERATKSGIGSASVALPGGLIVGALVAVNASGDVVDPTSGAVLAGTRAVPGQAFYPGILNMMQGISSSPPAAPVMENTVIGVVATNATLSKEGANKMAQMAQDGLAQALRPAHSMYDGDTIFALATGEIPADISMVGAFAAEVTARAIVNAVRAACSLGGVPAWNASTA